VDGECECPNTVFGVQYITKIGLITMAFQNLAQRSSRRSAWSALIRCPIHTSSRRGRAIR